MWKELTHLTVIYTHTQGCCVHKYCKLIIDDNLSCFSIDWRKDALGAKNNIDRGDKEGRKGMLKTLY